MEAQLGAAGLSIGEMSLLHSCLQDLAEDNRMADLADVHGMPLDTNVFPEFGTSVWPFKGTAVPHELTTDPSSISALVKSAGWLALTGTSKTVGKEAYAGREGHVLGLPRVRASHWHQHQPLA